MERLNRELAAHRKMPDVDAANWSGRRLSAALSELHRLRHPYFRGMLAETGEYIATAANVHGSYDTVLPVLRALFDRLREAVEAGLAIEENDLYPAVITLEREPTSLWRHICENALSDRRRSQEEALNLLGEMREVSRGYRLPEEACPTYTLAYRRLLELEEGVTADARLKREMLAPRIKALCGDGSEP